MTNGKIVTLGEILIRFSKQKHNRLMQLGPFNGVYGGSEANVAVSLATLGNDVEYVTRVPDNVIGDASLMALRENNVDTSHVVRGGARLGAYYFEEAASLRSSRVVYDREDSSFYTLEPGMINWREIFKNAEVFHCSGITCAISQNAADATFEAVKTASDMGLTISCDINYRKNLWKYEGADASKTLHDLISNADIIFGDQGEYRVATGCDGVHFRATSSSDTIDLEAYRQWFELAQKQYPRCKVFIMALRNQMSSDHHTLTGLIFTGGKLYHTRIYDIQQIVDPMGVGDAFCAGYLHARTVFDDPQMCLDYALAASTLKNSIKGDFNLSTDEEIRNLVDLVKNDTLD
ncbi:MAG: sugar kinase [Prevotella sp.]|nr:sugar kinase [Prevotella sp.]